jgi:hypothetical protein
MIRCLFVKKNTFLHLFILWFVLPSFSLAAQFNVTNGATVVVNSSLTVTSILIGSDCTLAGNGQIIALETVINGTVAPTGSLQLLETDTLDINGSATINFDGISSAAQPVYIIANYGSLVGSAFANVLNLPANYFLDYNYNDGISVNNIALVAMTTYQIWGQTYGLTLSGNDGFLDDPNEDGTTNIEHFAFNTDPLGNGSDEGKRRFQLFDPGSGQHNFALTVPIRSGAAFDDNVDTLTTDSLVYNLQGTGTLQAPYDRGISEWSPAQDTGLPAVDDGYEYRTFYLTDPISELSKGFMFIELTVQQ